MSELFNNLVLKKEERKAFPKHFLASVHSEVRSPDINSAQVFQNRDVLTRVLSNLGFVECQDINQAQMTLSNEADKPATLTQKITRVGLKFISHEPKREIQIVNGSIIIADFAYDSLERFLERFRDLFAELEKILKISKQSRVDKVGLRKINSIIIKPVEHLPDSLNIFNPTLFGIARSGLVPMDSFRTLEEAVVLHKKDQLSLLRIKLEKKEVDEIEANLDFDLVSREKLNFEEALSKTLLTLNQTHFELFMWSVTKDMIELMEAS